MSSNTTKLQKYKKNEIVEAIRKVGLDLKEFDLGENDDEALIKHKMSNAHFTIAGNPSKYTIAYASEDVPVLQIDKYTWAGVMTSFEGWLFILKTDLETPDLWAELQGEGELFRNISDTTDDNTPFTQQEKKKISTQLKKLGE